MKQENVYCVIKVYEQLIAEITVLKDAIQNAHLNVRGIDSLTVNLYSG